MNRPAVGVGTGPDISVAPSISVALWCHTVLVTLIIVDDHGPFREFARTMLEEDGFDVVGEAADGKSAVDAVRSLTPDVVLLDVQLGDGIDGFEVARQLAVLPHAPQVVLISSRDEESYASRLAETPVEGFVSKDRLSATAVRALLAPV